MKYLNKCWRCFAIVLMLIAPLRITAQNKAPAVDLVLCVDMSGSTTGIVERLKESFFEIANSCGSVSPPPDLRIAVVGFGRPGFLSANSFVKVLSDFDISFDSTATVLLKLRPYIEKGDQLVGAALVTCINKLSWSKDKKAVKIICLVGNGDVYMGGTTVLQSACESAKKKHIVINTFYCMSSLYSREIGGWNKVADLCDGHTYQVEVGKREPFALTVPQELLVNLNTEFNNSFVSYTEEGAAAVNRIRHLDEDFLQYSLRSYNSWLLYKVSDNAIKGNGKWDLVAYSNKKYIDFNKFDKSKLTKEYSTLNGRQIIDKLRMCGTTRLKVSSKLKSSLQPFSYYSANKGKTKNIIDFNDDYFATGIVYSVFKTLKTYGFKLPPAYEMLSK